ncbi:transcription/translation regulatory transformer protein RfaH [Herbaspirillum chlorophenolicum]|uniref:transcription/translation regulatory transformer protein RfaH n=1 Tax=Herbaspirillum chlorophenolicum TaxID=211589 RepID=UPI00067E338D|nr:transcription/translation regulatory transformer protein RfaH [Herbaspirillum chlorophenolicum]
MYWYLIHAKPRQEQTALTNLQQQDFECYLPLHYREHVSSSGLVINAEPLFPRYLFIHLNSDKSARSWAPIRSTRGVSRLVCFGNEPAKIESRLIDALRSRENATAPAKQFRTGDTVLIDEGPFKGLEALYQMQNGEQRAMILIEMLSRPILLDIDRHQLRRIK